MGAQNTADEVREHPTRRRPSSPVVSPAASDRVPPHTRRGFVTMSPTPDESALTPDPHSTLVALGWSDRWAPYLAAHDSGVAARVVRHDGSAVLVGSELGTHHVPVRRSMPPLAVGDWIVVSGDRIEELLPRASLLQRRDPSTGGSQPIAANVDVVGIVCGLDRPVTPGRVQRFTSLAWDAGATPLVILSKADLVDSTDNIEQDLLEQDPAAEIISVSSTTADGTAALLERCADNTLVLVGESGAGKSTLLNALAGSEVSGTGDVRDGDSKGRHTTTARQLFVLQGNCRLIDTPGVREVGIHTDLDTIDDGFSDIMDLAAHCQFRDCGHTNEPGCEVLAALADGRLHESRMKAWDQLRREAAWAEVRTDPAAQHRADRKLGRLIKDAKRQKRR